MEDRFLDILIHSCIIWYLGTINIRTCQTDVRPNSSVYALDCEMKKNFSDCCVRDPQLYYFYKTTLNISPSIEDLGDGVQWKLFGCLLLSWVLVYLCVIKGVKSSGKVTFITSMCESGRYSFKRNKNSKTLLRRAFPNIFILSYIRNKPQSISQTYWEQRWSFPSKPCSHIICRIMAKKFIRRLFLISYLKGFHSMKDY